MHASLAMQLTPGRGSSYGWFVWKWTRWTLMFFVALDMGLAIFEVPAVPGLALPIFATMTMETLCLAVFAVRLAHAATFYRDKRRFWRDKKHIAAMATLVLNVVDMTVYGVTMSQWNVGLRFSRIFRPLYLIAFAHGVRRGVRTVRRTLRDIVGVMVLLWLLIAAFGLLALELYRDRPEGALAFYDFMESFWSFYVLSTNSNNPDVTIPAYTASRWNAVLFVVFLTLGLFIMLSVVLAVAYNNYRKVGRRRRYACTRVLASTAAAARGARRSI